MLIHSASQLLTLAGGPQRGSTLGTLGLIPDGAVLVRNGRIEATGSSAELLQKYPNEPRVDAGGRVVMPGFVDPHTHLMWAGDRVNDFEMRLEGKTYLEIQAAGGGILSTVKASRTAGVAELMKQTRARAQDLLAHGTTTAEVKSGYGLNWSGELDLLQAILALDAEGPLELVPTYMGAHSIAPEFKGDPQGYTDFLCQDLLPRTQQWWLAEAGGRPLPFVDVFCETGAFDLAQTRQILTTAKTLGFPLKIHADEFANLGGTSLAVELGAASADHLVKASVEDIAALGSSQTVATALPPTPFGLGSPHYTPAREILQAGGCLAIASDTNPGTAWCGNMQFVIALACRYLKLTPAQAVAAATINAAQAIQRAETIGSLEPGKQADMIILKAANYRYLAYRFGTNQVQTVIKKGEIVYANA